VPEYENEVAKQSATKKEHIRKQRSPMYVECNGQFA